MTAGSQYAQFVANYGWPALAPGKWSNPYGVTAAGAPYVVCTTCHNQHVMTVYTSSAASQIQNDGGGKWYATYFFINAPYNPNLQTYASTSHPRRQSSAVSATLASRTKPTTPTPSKRSSSRKRLNPGERDISPRFF